MLLKCEGCGYTVYAKDAVARQISADFRDWACPMCGHVSELDAAAPEPDAAQPYRRPAGGLRRVLRASLRRSPSRGVTRREIRIPIGEAALVAGVVLLVVALWLGSR